MFNEDSEEDKDSEGLNASIRGYLNFKHLEDSLPLHPRRSVSCRIHFITNNESTLDQSYYYMLNDTSFRDKDQVVSRWVRRQDQPRNQRLKANKSHNILMVDQLWLWFIKGQGNEPDTVITSFPSHQGADSTVADYYARKVLEEQDRDPVSSTSELIARIMTVCCSTLNRHQDMPSTQFLQFFESAIGEAVSSQ